MSNEPKKRSEKRAAAKKIKGGVTIQRQMPPRQMDAQTRKTLRRLYGGI